MYTLIFFPKYIICATFHIKCKTEKIEGLKHNFPSELLDF